MIVASIAMEELALSHIVNAEGEKLQYILGTLSEGHKACASTQEILEVNKSVNKLLDTVMQSQMLLKGKLDSALEAGNCGSVPPGPHRPCEPSHRPPCNGSCCKKDLIQLTGQCDGACWENGSLMYWSCKDQRGESICWNEKTPALVSLDPRKTYELHYTINVREHCPLGNTGAVLVKLTPHNAFSNVLPLYFSTKCLECSPLTLHYSAMLIPKACPAPCADLSLLLEHKGGLFVEQASLSIVEI